jgi:hypothetical protein
MSLLCRQPRGHDRRALAFGRLRDVAAGEVEDLGAGVGEQRLAAGNRAREVVVDHDRWDCRGEAQGGCQQRLGDPRRHHRKIRGVRLRNSDEAVHDAPHRAEQSDERRGGTDRTQNAGAACGLPANR